MSDYYSDLKAAWHVDRVAAMRRGEQIAPVELQFILSDLCNQDCYFCAYRAEAGLSTEQFVEWVGTTRVHNPKRTIPKEKALQILDDARELGTKSVIFTGGGEPTVHPDHMEIFAHALDLGFDCSLNTNGIVLRKGWEDVFPQFTYIRFSIDAASAEEYARVRRVPESQYAKALDNLKRVVDVCSPESTVGAGYVVTPDGYRDIAEGVRNIRDTGAEYVRLGSMQSTQMEEPYKGVLGNVKARLQEAQNEARENFKVIDLFSLTLGKRAAGPLCGMQQFVLYIGGNLKIYRCCYTAYTKLGEIGDLSDQSFAEWFASAEKQKLIGEFDARSCFTCPLEHKNATIRYMADPKPPHVHFV